MLRHDTGIYSGACKSDRAVTDRAHKNLTKRTQMEMYHFIPSVFFCTKQPAERGNLLALQKIPPFFAPGCVWKTGCCLTLNLPSFYISHVLYFTSLPYNTARNMNTEQKRKTPAKRPGAAQKNQRAPHRKGEYL